MLILGTLATAAMQAGMLQLIAHHPSANPSMDMPLCYQAVNSVPLVVLLVIHAFAHGLDDDVARHRRSFLCCWHWGLFGTCVAYANYSHNTPGLLGLGFLAQCAVVLSYASRVVRLRRRVPGAA